MLKIPRYNFFQYASERRSLAFTIYLITFFFIPSIFGQAFQRLSEDNGLPTNLCNDISQDSLGFVWIATENGLVRYDGVQPKVYHPILGDSSSISNHSIHSIYIGPSHTLWASGNDGYLNKYDAKRDLFDRIYLNEVDDIPDRRIFDYYEDKDYLWLACELGILKHHIADGSTEVIFPQQMVSNNNNGFIQTCYALHQDNLNPNILWIGTRGGLLSLDKSVMEITIHTEYLPEIADYGQYAIKKIWQDPLGTLWVSGSWSGMKKYEPEIKKWHYFFSGYYPESAIRNDVSDFTFKSAQEFWICSYANGFGTFNINTGNYNYFTVNPMSSYSVQPAPVSKVLKDRVGNVWIAGYHGVSTFNPASQQIQVLSFPDKKVPHALTDILSTSFEKISDSELLVGTRSGDGLYIADLKNNTCKTFTNFKGKSYTQILEKQTSTSYYDLQVNDLLKVNDSKIWVAMDTQFAYFDIPSKSLVFPEVTNIPFFKSCDIRFLQLDRQGNLWGINFHRRAIFKCNSNTGELIEQYPYRDLLPDGIGKEKAYGIRSFHIDDQNRLWMISYSYVFCKNLSTGTVKIYPKKIG